MTSFNLVIEGSKEVVRVCVGCVCIQNQATSNDHSAADDVASVDDVTFIVHLSLSNGDKVEAFIDLLWWEGTLVKPAGGKTPHPHPFSST